MFFNAVEANGKRRRPGLEWIERRQIEADARQRGRRKVMRARAWSVERLIAGESTSNVAVIILKEVITQMTLRTEYVRGKDL